MEKNKILSQIIFSSLPGWGPILSRRLLEDMGGLDKIFNAELTDFSKLETLSEKGAKSVFYSLQDKELKNRAESEFLFLEKNNISCLFIEDETYPYRLKQCPDAPLLLYYMGTADLNAAKILGIVGSRKATDYGKKLTYDLLESLNPVNPLIISGLAYGIDIAAHQGALKFSMPTVGVLGHGLDKLYPASHYETSKKMKANGGLLTEFKSDTPIQPGLFPRRNRIIAGLCDALVVVEASEKGGALITAELANSYNRDVFAFPGRVNDTYSSGCLQLIRDQKAQLIQNGDELIKFLNWEKEVLTFNEKPAKIKDEKPDLNPKDQLVLDFIIQKGKLRLEDLRLEFSDLSKELPEIILNLEIFSKIRTLPGNYLESI